MLASRGTAWLPVISLLAWSLQGRGRAGVAGGERLQRQAIRIALKNLLSGATRLAGLYPGLEPEA